MENAKHITGVVRVCCLFNWSRVNDLRYLVDVVRMVGGIN
jgi:hypothetical protein